MIRVNRSSLLNSLEAVQPGLSPRDIVEQSSCYVFYRGKVITYNDEVSCRKESPLPPEFTGAVAAKPLTSLLSKMAEDEVSVEQVDGHLVIHGKRRRGGVRMDAEITLPIKNVEKPGEWKPLPENFGDAVSMVEHCAGKDEAKFVLTCMNVTSQFIEACDDLQISRYMIETPVEKPFLVRRDSLKHITSLDMTEFSETEAWVHFRNPSGLILSCRRWVDEYPSMTEYLKVDGEPMTLPKGLVEEVEKAQIFSSENQDDNVVSVELRQGQLKLVGEGTSGWYKAVKKVKYNGQDMMFRISPKLLTELVSRHNECVVTDTRLKVDGGKWVYVTCLGQPQTDEPSNEPVEEEES